MGFSSSERGLDKGPKEFFNTLKNPYSITYAQRPPNTARHARIEERKGYKDTQKTPKGTQKSRLDLPRYGRHISFTQRSLSV
jgi:hypothetical protein